VSPPPPLPNIEREKEAPVAASCPHTIMRLARTDRPGINKGIPGLPGASMKRATCLIAVYKKWIKGWRESSFAFESRFRSYCLRASRRQSLPRKYPYGKRAFEMAHRTKSEISGSPPLLPLTAPRLLRSAHAREELAGMAQRHVNSCSLRRFNHRGRLLNCARDRPLVETRACTRDIRPPIPRLPPPKMHRPAAGGDGDIASPAISAGRQQNSLSTKLLH